MFKTIIKKAYDLVIGDIIFFDYNVLEVVETGEILRIGKNVEIDTYVYTRFNVLNKVENSLFEFPEDEVVCSEDTEFECINDVTEASYAKLYYEEKQ